MWIIWVVSSHCRGGVRLWIGFNGNPSNWFNRDRSNRSNGCPSCDWCQSGFDLLVLMAVDEDIRHVINDQRFDFSKEIINKSLFVFWQECHELISIQAEAMDMWLKLQRNHEIGSWLLQSSIVKPSSLDKSVGSSVGSVVLSLVSIGVEHVCIFAHPLWMSIEHLFGWLSVVIDSQEFPSGNGTVKQSNS